MEKDMAAKRKGAPRFPGERSRKPADDCRAEKLEDARAKAAIRAQIEADKKARADKAAREKAIREGQPVPPTAAETHVPPPARAAPVSGVKGADFKETRLQVRLSTGGAPLIKSFNSDARESSWWSRGE